MEREFFGSKDRELRRIFTPEEKKAILKTTKGVCARCGKKLNLKTATMEHIIPLSRGGTNSPENLTVLCEQCNKDKGNLFYLPAAFYSALVGTGKLPIIEKMTAEWFQTQKDKFDLETYPLIAPKDAAQIYMGTHKQSRAMVRQLIMEWKYTSEKQLDRLSREIGIDIKKRRYQDKTMIKELRGLSVPEWNVKIATYAMYRLTTQKLDAVALVCYNRESQFLAIDVLWCALPPSYGYGLLRKFMMDLIYAIMVVAGETLDQYMLITPYDYMLGAFQENCPCVNDKQYILPVAIQTAVRADEPEKFLYILRGIVTPLEESYERTRQAQSTIGYSLKNQTLPGFTLHKNISGLPSGLET